MKTITPSQLKNLVDADPSTPLLDVRTSVEFDGAHVPSAWNKPLDELNPSELVSGGRVPGDQAFYILCHSGKRAGKAAEKFQAAGFANAIVVEGGTQAWIDSGYPVNRGQSKVISLERQVRIAAGSLVLLGFLLSYLVHPYLIWLSAFVGGGLVFAGITDFCGMGLLLARMPWNKR